MNREPLHLSRRDAAAGCHGRDTRSVSYGPDRSLMWMAGGRVWESARRSSLPRASPRGSRFRCPAGVLLPPAHAGVVVGASLATLPVLISPAQTRRSARLQPLARVALIPDCGRWSSSVVPSSCLRRYAFASWALAAACLCAWCPDHPRSRVGVQSAGSSVVWEGPRWRCRRRVFPRWPEQWGLAYRFASMFASLNQVTLSPPTLAYRFGCLYRLVHPLIRPTWGMQARISDRSRIVWGSVHPGLLRGQHNRAYSYPRHAHRLPPTA